MGLRAVKGGNQALAGIKAKLAAFPRTLAQEVATRGAPQLTEATQEAFQGGQTVYGEARPLGVNGNRLSLRRTGDTERELRFVAIGTQLRARLGTRYARYLIGKYSVLPNGALPSAWRAKLENVMREVKPT